MHQGTAYFPYFIPGFEFCCLVRLDKNFANWPKMLPPDFKLTPTLKLSRGEYPRSDAF